MKKIEYNKLFLKEKTKNRFLARQIGRGQRFHTGPSFVAKKNDNETFIAKTNDIAFKI